MKSLTLICLASDRDQTLERLREMGVVHLVNVRAIESKDVDRARSQLAQISRTLEVLPPKSGKPASGVPPAMVVQIIWDLLQEKKDLEDELDHLQQERLRLLPYGSFDPRSVEELRKRGVYIRLYQVAPGRAMKPPEGALIEKLSEDKQGVYFAVVSRSADARVRDAQEFPMPSRSLAEVEARIAEVKERLAENAKLFVVHEGDHAVVARMAAAVEDQVRFLEARVGMGSIKPISYLRGFFPAEAEDRLRAASKEFGWGILIEDPGADQPVPTLIRNPRWVEPIKTVFDAIGIMPGYREIDISAFFLVFLSVFFAMLVGDAGYGALFLAITLWARRKLPAAPAQPFMLLYIMSACTIVWGVITGTYFGMAAEAIPEPLARLKIQWLQSPDNVMHLCFLIGSIHLTIAHTWNIIRMRNSPRAIAQLGWIGTTWTMYFMARMLVLGHDLPGWVMYMFAVSVAAIILFLTAPRDFKSEWFNHVMLPLNLVSNFVDVVSYLRLFAVGTASFAVASAFNEMALAGGVKGVLGGLIAALVLFVGHAMNIALASLGVLVHGVRLNTLEFSSHLGMQWTGQPYRPFARRAVDVR